MWSRKVIKQKAKARMSESYWRMVLAALLITIAIGGWGGATATSAGAGGGTGAGALTFGSLGNAFDQDDMYDYDMSGDGIEEDLGRFYDDNRAEIAAFTLATLSAGLAIALIVMAVSIAITAFLLNPLQVGGMRFFYQNIDRKAGLKELLVGLDKNYMNTVKIMFLRGLFTFLWGLLFVIPGIVKAYEYRMIPYLLAEEPDISREEAFAVSRRMMQGNKWKAFVFDLSFIGWYILGAMTCGILNLFYTHPYYYQADAMLYDAIKIDDQKRA